MKYSLIIPAYNEERNIAGCLQSALNQSVPREDYEVIVVDDGSKDATRSIVRQFPVRLIEQSNQGPAAARNNGAFHAAGDWLIFTDADCELDPKFIESIVKPLQDQDLAVVGAQGCYQTRQEGFVPRFDQIEIEKRYERMARQRYIDFIATYSACYRRDVFLQAGGFDTAFRAASCEDAELSYRLQENGCKLVFVPTAIVFHKHPTTLKQHLRVKFYRAYWRVRLARLHPGKAIRDSFTPHYLKIQVLTTPLIPVLLLLSLFDRRCLVPLAALCLLYFCWSIPYMRMFVARGYRSAYLVPPMMLLRTGAMAAGLFCGLLNGKIVKPSVKSAAVGCP
jgi:GT2 family glycosyltransferase